MLQITEEIMDAIDGVIEQSVRQATTDITLTARDPLIDGVDAINESIATAPADPTEPVNAIKKMTVPLPVINTDTDFTKDPSKRTTRAQYEALEVQLKSDMNKLLASFNLTKDCLLTTSGELKAERKALEKDVMAAQKKVVLNFKIKHGGQMGRDSALQTHQQITTTNLYINSARLSYTKEAIAKLESMKEPNRILGKNVKEFSAVIKKLKKKNKPKYLVMLNSCQETLITQLKMANDLLLGVKALLNKAINIDDANIMELEGHKTDLEILKLQIKDKEVDLQTKEIEVDDKTTEATNLDDVIKAKNKSLANLKTENNNLKAEKKTVQVAVEDVKREKKKELDKSKADHKAELKNYRDKAKELRDEHEMYVKYFGKALHNMQKDGLQEIKDATKYQSFIQKSVSNAAKQSIKRIKQASDKEKTQWSVKTIAKVSVLCLLTDITLVGASLGMFMAIQKAGGIQSTPVAIVAGCVLGAIASIIFDIILVVSVAMWMNREQEEHQELTQPVTEPILPTKADILVAGMEAAL